MIEVRQTTTFAKWLTELRDNNARLRIVTRIRRMELGNPGDVKAVGEMRITYGPAYRVYFVTMRSSIVVLLCGGDKLSQSRDISLVKQMAKEI